MSLFPKHQKKINFKNTPAELLSIVSEDRKDDFEKILRHVKTQSEVEQAKFLKAKDQKGRHALLIAARQKNKDMVKKLLSFDFDLTVTDVLHHRVLYYLLKAEDMQNALIVLERIEIYTKKEAFLLSRLSIKLPLKTAGQRKKIGKLISQENGGMQTGRISKLSDKKIKRGYHSFEALRERQLLRHFSTQLFHYFNRHLDNGNLVEIETMHLRYGNTSNLFVAANEHSVTQKFQDIIAEMDLTDALTTPFDGITLEDIFRSRRYAKKLNLRIFDQGVAIPNGTVPNDRKKASMVGNIILEQNCSILSIELTADYQLNDKSKKRIKNILAKSSNTIFFLEIVNCESKLRHAEEFLTDIATYAKDCAKKQKIACYTAVAGKKRPCMACSGRMEGVIDSFNTHAGPLWLNTIEAQPKAIAVKTIEILLKKQACVTLTEQGKIEPSYDSGSDTDIDSTEDEFESSEDESDSTSSTPRARI